MIPLQTFFIPVWTQTSPFQICDRGICTESLQKRQVACLRVGLLLVVAHGL